MRGRNAPRSRTKRALLPGSIQTLAADAQMFELAAGTMAGLAAATAEEIVERVVRDLRQGDTG